MSFNVVVSLKDDKKIKIPLEIAKMSNFFATMLEGQEEVSGIELPIPSVNEEIFTLVVEFLEKCNIPIPEQLVSADMKENLLNNPLAAEFMDQWDHVLLSSDVFTKIIELLNASVYLIIDNLTDLCCMKLACLMKKIKVYNEDILKILSGVKEEVIQKKILDYLDFVDLQKLPWELLLNTEYNKKKEKFEKYNRQRIIPIKPPTMSCSPDGKFIGSGRYIWKEDANFVFDRTLEDLPEPKPNHYDDRICRFSGDGNFYGILRRGYVETEEEEVPMARLQIWNNFDKVYQIIELDKDWFINAMVLSYNGENAVVGGTCLKVIRVADKEIILDLPNIGADTAIHQVIISKNGKYIGYIARKNYINNNVIQIIDLSGKLVFKYDSGETNPFLIGIAFSDDGQYLAIYGELNEPDKMTGFLSIYDIKTKANVFYKEVDKAKGFHKGLGKSNIVFSKCGLFLIYGQTFCSILNLVNKKTIELKDDSKNILDISMSSNDTIALMSHHLNRLCIDIWKQSGSNKDGGNRRNKIINSRKRRFKAKKSKKTDGVHMKKSKNGLVFLSEEPKRKKGVPLLISPVYKFHNKKSPKISNIISPIKVKSHVKQPPKKLRSPKKSPKRIKYSPIRSPRKLELYEDGEEFQYDGHTYLKTIAGDFAIGFEMLMPRNWDEVHILKIDMKSKTTELYPGYIFNYKKRMSDNMKYYYQFMTVTRDKRYNHSGKQVIRLVYDKDHKLKKLLDNLSLSGDVEGVEAIQKLKHAREARRTEVRPTSNYVTRHTKNYSKDDEEEEENNWTSL